MSHETSLIQRPEVVSPPDSSTRKTFENDRFQALIAASGQVVWSWSLSGLGSDLERSRLWWAELTGQSLEEQDQGVDSWLNVVHPDDRAVAQEAWHTAIGTGERYDVCFRVRARLGGWSYVHVRGCPVREANGEVREWVGTLENVTDQHATAAQLARMQRKYETALAHSADFVYLFDTSGRFTYINEGLLRLLGRELSDAVGKNFFELDYPEQLAEKLQLHIQQVVDTGLPLRDETPYTSAEGTEIYEYIFVPVFGPDGQVEAVAGSTRQISARKRAEEALRASEERHRALVTATSDVVYRMSADWSEMQPLDGRGLVASNADPIKDWMHKNVPDFEHARLRDAIQTAIRNKSTFELEHQVIGNDSKLGWTFSRAVPIVDSQGEVIEWFGMASDVTRRKQAEEALSDITSRMEAARAAGAIGTWSWDVQADEFYGDASLAKIFGVSPADVAGGKLSRMMNAIHPDDQERISKLIAHAIEHSDHYEAEYRVAQTDGSWKWITARGRIDRDEAGKPIRFPGVVIDVSDWKQAQAELARVTDDSDRRKRIYETILSNTPDFAYVIGLDHRFIYANETLLRMWGVSWDEAVGKTFLEIGYEQWHADLHDREVDEVISTRKPIRGEIPFHGTFGRRIYDYIFVPVLNSAGEVEAIAGTTRDVTERKQSEEAARQADRKKDDFLAILAHELRNPLAPIRNGLQVLRLAENNPTAIAHARDIMDRQLSHMVRLIDDLLDISRITRNKMELKRCRISLAEVINNAIEAASPIIDGAGHELSVSLSSRPIMIDADLTRLAQVVANLLTNSAKYTPRGGKIVLTAKRTDQQAVVEVTDNGAGIPKSALPNIFEMFSQVDRTLERNSGGLGIGLALVKALTEMHGGSVEVESEEGRGSTFTVRLPIVEDLSSVASSHAPIALTANGRCRILVVDDNRDSAASLAMVLKLLGNDVHTAHDGLEAIAVAEQFKPDLILMDIGLPHLNGLEATRRIKEQPWGQRMWVTALTGWGKEADREQSRQAGCDGHLVKPVEINELKKLLLAIANGPPAAGR